MKKFVDGLINKYNDKLDIALENYYHSNVDLETNKVLLNNVQTMSDIVRDLEEIRMYCMKE